MRQTRFPCKTCHKRLSRTSIDSAMLWSSICEDLAETDPYLLLQCTCAEEACYCEVLNDFKELEQLGFIVSHEVKSPFTIVKVLGSTNDSGDICIHRH